MLPFSSSAQLGILMVIFAIQMLAFGSMPFVSFLVPNLWLGLDLVCGFRSHLMHNSWNPCIGTDNSRRYSQHLGRHHWRSLKCYPKGLSKRLNRAEPIPPILKSFLRHSWPWIFVNPIRYVDAYPWQSARNGHWRDPCCKWGTYLLSILVTLDKMRSNMEGTK